MGNSVTLTAPNGVEVCASPELKERLLLTGYTEVEAKPEAEAEAESEAEAEPEDAPKRGRSRK